MSFKYPYDGATHKTMKQPFVKTETMLVCPFDRLDTGNFAINEVDLGLFIARCQREGHVAELFFNHPAEGFQKTILAQELPEHPERNGFRLYSIADIEAI